MLRFTLRVDIWQTQWWREYVTGNLTENPVNCRWWHRSILLRGTDGTLQKMAYWAVWMSIDKRDKDVSSRRAPPFIAERWSGQLHSQRLSVARLVVNGSGNTDFRLPWDLWIITEVMRSECREDFFDYICKKICWQPKPAGSRVCRDSDVAK